MSFKDAVSTFEKDILDAIKRVEGVGSDLLARILHKHAVQTDAAAVATVVSLGMEKAKMTVEQAKSSADAAVQHIETAIAADTTAPISAPEPTPVATPTPAPSATPVQGTPTSSKTG